MEKFSTILKNSVLGIILLGALGSGTWERILEPFFANLFATAIGSIYQPYIDYLHSDIGKGVGGQPIPYFGVVLYLFLIVILSAPIYLNIKERGKVKTHSLIPTKDEEEFKETNHSFHTKYLFWTTLSLIGMIFITALFVKGNYNERAVTFVERSIEIIAPKLLIDQSNENPATESCLISNNIGRILCLRAKYRAIEDTCSYARLHKELLKLAKRYKLELPKFESLAKEKDACKQTT